MSLCFCEAIGRGYQSGKDTKDPLATAQQSFFSTMYKKTDVFERCGEGYFKVAK